MSGVVRTAILAVLAAGLLAACDNGHERVDVLVEVTATGGTATFRATLESHDQDDIDFSGTTPFSVEFDDRRLPVEVHLERLTGSGLLLTLCVTNLDSGKRSCRERTGTFVDVEL